MGVGVRVGVAVGPGVGVNVRVGVGVLAAQAADPGAPTQERPAAQRMHESRTQMVPASQINAHTVVGSVHADDGQVDESQEPLPSARATDGKSKNISMSNFILSSH